MTGKARLSALSKLAFCGPADVYGSPSFDVPVPTVGQAMTGINANLSIPAGIRRSALDRIVRTGIDVNSPARKLFGAGLGALAGNLVSRAFGFGLLGRTAATAIGANYGTRF